MAAASATTSSFVGARNIIWIVCKLVLAKCLRMSVSSFDGGAIIHSCGDSLKNLVLVGTIWSMQIL